MGKLEDIDRLYAEKEAKSDSWFALHQSTHDQIRSARMKAAEKQSKEVIEDRTKQLESVIDSLISDNIQLQLDKKELIDLKLTHASVEPSTTLQPTLIQLCRFYSKAVVEVIFEDGEIAVCQDWWMTENMFWCTSTDNDKEYEIEIVVDPQSKDFFKGKIILHLIDPSEMSELMKADYHAYCKRIRFGEKTIRIDTPSSLLWLNNVDAFDLIQTGRAKSV